MHIWPALTGAMDDLEEQYRAHYLAADARQTSVAIAIWLIPVLLFACADYVIFGASSRFAALLTVRLAFCLFSLYTIAALSKVATAGDYDRAFLRWAAAGVAVVLFFNYTWAYYVPPNGAITVLVIFSAYMVFPNRLGIRLIPPLILSAGNLLLEWRLGGPLGPNPLFTASVAAFMANVLGIIFSTWLQNHRRVEFRARLEEARAKEELGRLAATDDLTGVFNRRKLLHLASEEYERFLSGNQPLSVLMIDIDHFKKLNDTYGHEAGNLVLTGFTAYVAKNLGEKDIWGRLGGDEFVLVLPDVVGEQARLVAERLRLGLENEFVLWHGQPLTFTITIGVTQAREKDQSFENVLKRADKALYRAKRRGRNRTELL